jgi:gluconokinase
MNETVRTPRLLILCGVSGSGKTTIGQEVASKMGWAFADADDFHPPENVAKMRAGIPLTTEDRFPWLQALRHWLEEKMEEGQSAVLACSALRQVYREMLAKPGEPIHFIYLNGDFDTIYERLKARSGHYMPPELLRSQFEALEPPTDAFTLDIRQPKQELVRQLLDWIG